MSHFACWVFAGAMFCNGILVGGVVWKLVPFPTWEGIKRRWKGDLR